MNEPSENTDLPGPPTGVGSGGMRWARLGSRLPLLVTALLLAWHSLGDLDIWLHWRVGGEILAGRFPQSNLFTFSAAGVPWFDHEWLFQVLIAGVGKLATALANAPTDPATLAAGWNTLRLALVLVLTTLLVRPTQSRSHLADAWTLPAQLLGLGLLWPRLTIRPELISYLMLVLTIPAIEKCMQAPPGRRPGWRSYLHPGHECGRVSWLALVWAQFHGFAVLVPLLVLLAGILFPLQAKLNRNRQPFDWRRWATTLAFCWLALGLTPAGWRGWVYPFTVIGQFRGHGADLRGTISELVPLARSPQSLFTTILLFKVAVLWGLGRILLAWPRPNILRSLVFFAAAWAAWFSARNLGFAAVAFMLLPGGDWGGPPQPIRRILHARAVSRTLTLLPLAAALGALLVWWPGIIHDDFYLREGVGRRFGGGLTPAVYPIDATAALAGQKPQRTFANLDAAAFVIARTANPLFIDGRTELFPAATWNTYNLIKQGGTGALAELDRQRVTAVCLAQGSGAADGLAGSLQNEQDWSLQAAGPGGMLWVKNSPPPSGDVLGRAVSSARESARSCARAARAADLFLAASRLAELAGLPAQSATILQEGLSRRPDHPGLLHNLGNREMAKGDFPAAARHFAAAVEVNPRQSGSMLNAGVCALNLGDAPGAVTWFRRAVALDPDDFQGWANLGVAQMQNGDRPSAIAALEKAVALRPQDPGLRNRLRQLRGR